MSAFWATLARWLAAMATARSARIQAWGYGAAAAMYGWKALATGVSGWWLFGAMCAIGAGLLGLMARALRRRGLVMAIKAHCDHCDAVIPTGGDYYQLRVARRIVGTIWEPLVTERDVCPACLAIVAPGAGLEKEEEEAHGDD